MNRGRARRCCHRSRRPRRRPGRGAAAGAGSTSDLAIVGSMIHDAIEDGAVGDGTILYVGAGNTAGGPVAWQMDRPWRDLAGVDPTSIARLLGALGNAQRLRVVQLLVDGPMSTATLTASLEEPSSGQLFHHLKELLAVGLIYQPRPRHLCVPPTAHRADPRRDLVRSAPRVQRAIRPQLTDGPSGHQR